MSEHREAIKHLKTQAAFAAAHGEREERSKFLAAADALERLGRDDAPALAERVRRLERDIEEGMGNCERLDAENQLLKARAKARELEEKENNRLREVAKSAAERMEAASRTGVYNEAGKALMRDWADELRDSIEQKGHGSMNKKARIEASGDFDHFVYFCPGCNGMHRVPLTGPAHWILTGSPDRPTLSPSVNVTRGCTNCGGTICHSTIADGRITYSPNCTHRLAGQTVELAALERLGQDDAPDLAERVRRLEAERERLLGMLSTVSFELRVAARRLEKVHKDQRFADTATLAADAADEAIKATAALAAAEGGK